MVLRIISGVFQGRHLQSPKGSQTRPTKNSLREAVFNICQFYIEKAFFLDLFAGSGAMGFEALSRGASFTTFIEKDKLAARAIQENRKALKVEEQSQVLMMDFRRALEKLGEQGDKYNIVYIDPPYGAFHTEEIIDLLHKQDILHLDAQVFLEEESKEKQTSLEIPAFEEKKSRKWGKTHLRQFSFNG